MTPPDPAQLALAANIRRQRESLSIPPKAVAAFLGLDQGTVTRWEAGTREPGAVALAALAKALRCSTDKLLPTRDELKAAGRIGCNGKRRLRAPTLPDQP